MTALRYQRLETVENILRYITRNESKPFHRPVEPKPLLQVQPSRFRGMLSTNRRLSEVEFPITITPDGKHDLRGANILLEVRNNQGKVVARSTSLEGKTFLDPKLPQGKYSIKVELFSGKGERLTDASTSVEILPPSPGQMLIDEDGTLLREGKPFFPLGIYHVPLKDYDRAAEIGFNLFQIWSWDGTKALEILEKKGIVALWEQNHASPQTIAEHGKKLAAHRSLGLLYTGDEPSEERFDQMHAINDAWHQHVPNRPTYVVSYVPVNFTQNAAMADILAVDTYPWPHTPITAVSNIMDMARKATKGKQSIIFVPQCFGKEPEDAWRSMAFLALTHGAKGLIWYPWNQVGGGPVGLGMHDHPELQKAAKRLITELKAISPALTSTIPARYFVEANGKLHGMVCFDVEKQTAYLLLTNPTQEKLQYTLEIPELEESATTLKEAFSNQSIPVKQCEVSLNLEPYATRIYAWKKVLTVSDK